MTLRQMLLVGAVCLIIGGSIAWLTQTDRVQSAQASAVRRVQPVEVTEMVLIRGSTQMAFRFQYEDGLECVTVWNGGITCDWPKAEVKP